MFANLMNRGETIKLRELNAAFQNPQLIGVGYYQASLVVEAHRRALRPRRAAQAGRASTRKGMDDEAGLKAALNVDFDDLQASFDKAMEERFGALRAALKPPEGDAELLKMPVDALKALAEKNPDSFPAQMVLGTHCAETNDLDGALKALRTRRRARADGDRRRQPAPADRRDRASSARTCRGRLRRSSR